MSDVIVATLNRRTAVAAVRQEATRIGVDAEVLLDSKRFYDQLGTLDPDAPGFAAQIRDMVGTAAGQRPQSGPPARREAQEQPRQQSRQWTLDDVEGATPDEVWQAAQAGLLVGLGYAPSRKRR